MRKIDDAHDAEHEIEADADQAEIEPEQHAGDERVGQHALRPPLPAKIRLSRNRIMGAG